MASGKLWWLETLSGPRPLLRQFRLHAEVTAIERQVEAYTLSAGGYGLPLVLTPGQFLPLHLGGVHLGNLPVVALFV